MRLAAAFLTLGAALSLAGCDSDDDPTAPLEDAVFSIDVSGAETFTLSGRASVFPILPNGFVTNDPITGSRSEIQVTPIGLQSGPAEPTLFIGLLGPARPGVYTVRAGTGPVGLRPEFYANFDVLQPDGSRRSYAATSGTVTIESVSALGISGVFSFTSSRFVTWPPNSGPGTRATSVPTSLSASGTFVARKLGVFGNVAESVVAR